MPITLNHSNIGVQYSTGSNYIIETVKSDLYRRNEIYDNIVRDNIQAAPVTPIISIQDSSNVYAVESYTYSGSANTADFTRVFTKSTTCDILIVGGGGAGAGTIGGGGGAGSLIFAKNATLNGTYTINVGKGGIGELTGQGTKGNSSSISKDGINITAEGGGASGRTDGNQNGGSGGGGDYWEGNQTSGTSSSYTSTAFGATIVKYGNNGANAYTPSPYNGGGGGGAGGSALIATSTNLFSNGGSGLHQVIIGGETINFATIFGINTSFVGGVLSNGNLYYAGGGGAGGNESSLGGTGGIGGGGNGGRGVAIGGANIPIHGSNGLPNTGGGGGGGSNHPSLGGNGGSGIVIIRYLLGTIPANNLLTNEPVVVAPAFTETIRSFTHSGGAEAQTTHTITVGRDTICDILIVGGGGSGDRQIGGGGGGGAVLYATNITIPPGSYTIRVGKGGENGNGGNSEAFGATCLGGGSTPFVAWGTPNNGSSGGSGSGASPGGTPNSTGGTVGTSTKGTLLSSGTLYNGNVGGNALQQTQSSTGAVCGGGGGGAGTAGLSSSLTAYTTRSSWIAGGSPSKGGDGIQINITGTTYYWGAGGGGGSVITHAGDGGLGGGGGGGYGISSGLVYPAGLAGTGGINSGSNGLNTGTENGGNGGAGTGSGGGGGGYNANSATYNAGNGGSGIVIIKFKSTTAILDGITHKRLNFSYTPNYPFIQADNTNLIVWYKFDDPGYLGKDEFNLRNLTNTIVSTTSDLIGTSASFTNESYLSISNFNLNFDNTITTTGISFSFWFKLDSGSEYYGHLFTWGTHNSLEKFALIRNNLELKLTIQQGTNLPNTFDILAYNTWIHLVINIDTSRVLRVYQNTILVYTLTLTPSLYSGLTTSSPFTLGRANGVNIHDYRGGIEDFRIYNKVLTSTEISQLYSISTPNIYTYTLNFPVPTIADINNNSNIVLRGAYDIALTTTNAVITPKTGQYIPKPTTFTNYAIERMYPPVRNFTAATTTVSGQVYGNGTYVVSYSSTYGENIDPFKCFNTGDIVGGAWAQNRYTAGVFNSTSSIVSGYLGDWIKIQLPIAIKLTIFEFKQRITNPNDSPKDFKIYGSNDNITWVELVNKTDAIYNASYKYEQTTPEITNTYTYYGLVANKLLGSTSTILNFDEWYIYGQEVLTSSLSIRYNILNPILDPIGAQWTYSSSNTNVYHMGSVGIGTTIPEYQLDVRGAIYSSVGGYTQTGLTTWTVTSDKRIKDNIVRASYDKCLENVKNIELYNFNFKNNCVNTNDKHQLGFIAQEVQQVYPKAVEVGKMILNTNEAIDDILTLNTTQIDYTLYGAVKNLIEKIEDIDNDLENIEKLI